MSRRQRRRRREGEQGGFMVSKTEKDESILIFEKKVGHVNN
jgi:hypothetical protein